MNGLVMSKIENFFNIEYDISNEFAEAKKIYGSAATKAMNNALKIYCRSIHSSFIKHLATQNNVKQTTIRKRTKYKFKRNRNNSKGRIFIGILPVYLHDVGKMKQNMASNGGITARSHFSKGSFVWTSYSGKKIAIKRVGKNRYPLTTPKVNIAKKSTALFNAYNDIKIDVASKKFLQLFNAELEKLVSKHQK